MNLKDLSRHLNLSPTTVSRALNGYPEVAEATRVRVQEAARQMNYSPNVRARGLATGRAQAIGHVIPVTGHHQMVNPVFTDFLAGSALTYARAGYEMVLRLVENVNDPRVYQELHARGSVDGVIVSSPLINDPRIELLSTLGMPFVVHGRSTEARVPYSWVDTNNKGAFERATSFLLDLGHRRIGLINGLEEMDFAHRRRKGFEAALAARGMAPDTALLRSSDMTESYGYASTREMLSGPTPPTALLVSSMIIAIGARRAIHEAGLVLGRDISVITHDDDLGSFTNKQDVPIFTATRSSAGVAGERLADLLLAQIRDPGCAPVSEMLEAELIIGGSTGPAPR